MLIILNKRENTMKKIIITYLLILISNSAIQAKDNLYRFSKEIQGFINAKGKVVIPAEYSFVGEFSNCGLSLVNNGKKYGFINKKGQKVIDLKYDYADNFHEGLAYVEIDKEKYFINSKDEKIIDLKKYKQVLKFSEGLAAVFKNVNGETRCGFINTKGEEVIPCKFSVKFLLNEESFIFLEGLAVVGGDNNRAGCIDKKGNIVVPFVYGSLGSFSDGMAVYLDLNNREGGYHRYGFINKKGKIAIKSQFDHSAHFSEGFALITSGYKHYFIDKKGKNLNDKIYVKAKPFSEGLAVVKLQNTVTPWRYINQQGQIAIKLKNVKDAGSFKNGVALILNSNDVYTVINKNGEEVNLININGDIEID